MRAFFRGALKGLHRTAGSILPATLLARSYPGVPGRIHVDDLMLRSEGDAQWYVDGGRSAVHNIAESLCAAGRTFTDIGTCLDMACGYGRVTRHLIREIMPYKITACDADHQAVRFCAREFGVRPLLCDRDPRLLLFPDSYDLIWVGSLLTHLAGAAGVELLGVLAAALTPRGVLVFTTQGDSCLRHLDWYGPEFVAAEEAYHQGLVREGVWFAPYRRKRVASAQSPTDGTYGITLHTERYINAVLSRLGLALVRFGEREMERHQDVWSAQRS